MTFRVFVPMWQTGYSNSTAGGPQLKGARLFSFEELKKCTDGFSEANDIGSGGYGQVNLISLHYNRDFIKHHCTI